MVGESGVRFLVAFGQCDPGLDSVHAATLRPHPLESLRVRDSPTGGHPVHLARADRLLGAHAVAVHDLAIEQVCDGREARSEEHTSELQSLMRISYAVFCLKKKKT